MAIEPDLRVCFLGDSFVAGFGDPEHLGWAGRIAARAHRDGRSLTTYNLGIRLDTSAGVLARWRAECTPRLPLGCDARIVVSFGVNDMTDVDGALRVAPQSSVANLDRVLAEAEHRVEVLVVGPPPVADAAHNERTADLGNRYAISCRTRGVRYVGVFADLLASPCWMREVQAGDGAHPGAAGYQELADLVYPHWADWLATG